MTAAFQNVQHPADIVFFVFERMGDGIPHAGLSRQMQHHIRFFFEKYFLQFFIVADIQFPGPVSGLLAENGIPVTFEFDIVIRTEIVNTDYLP